MANGYPMISKGCPQRAGPPRVPRPHAGARRLRGRPLDLHRSKYGLLTAEDIRSLRERFGLTQGELGLLLRLGQNTLSRWEAGRNVQTAAMDVLLRVLWDVPGGLEYLRKHAA